MSQIKQATIDGLNNFLTENKKVPGECTIEMVQFDTPPASQTPDISRVYTGELSRCPAMTSETFIPRGSTPLYDAVGGTIVSTGEFLKARPEHDRPAKVIFVIITDGFENASKEYSAARVHEMVKHQTDVYHWQFVFLGAEFNTYDVGRIIGVSAANTMRYGASGQGVNCYTSDLGANVRAFRAGTKSDMSFTKEQKKRQEDAGAKQS